MVRASILLALLPTKIAGLSAASVQSPEDDIQIYGTSWGPTLAMDGTGIYNDFARSVFDKAGVYSSYKIGPYNRSKQTFLREESGCLYPSSISVLKAGDEMADDDDFIETTSFLLVKSYLFAARGQRQYDGEMSLKGKWVGYPVGSALPMLMQDSGASFLAINDEEDKAKLLITGRIDYMSGTLPDTAFVFKSLDQPLPTMDRRHLLFSSGVGVVCHRSEASEQLINRLNEAFLHQYQAGDLQKYLKNADLDPENYLPQGEE
jgi:ABC-type amino acid transport substrate-binding protein